LASVAAIATVMLAVFGAHRRGSTPETEGTGGDGTATVAAPATAPFAAPILAPPLETDPSPSAASASPPRGESVPSEPPPSPSAATPTSTAEPPQRLRAESRPVLDHTSPAPAPRPSASASAHPPKHKLPGSGL
jgi:hypothetical protein